MSAWAWREAAAGQLLPAGLRDPGWKPEDYSTWEESVSVREFTDAECLSSYHVAQVPRGSEASCILGSATAWF